MPHTFLERFALFADTPGAVAKMPGPLLDPSANGEIHTSLGRRPSKAIPQLPRAPKGRDIAPSPDDVPPRHPNGWVAPSRLRSFVDAIPRPLPWAGMGRLVEAERTAP